MEGHCLNTSIQIWSRLLLNWPRSLKTYLKHLRIEGLLYQNLSNIPFHEVPAGSVRDIPHRRRNEIDLFASLREPVLSGKASLNFDGEEFSRGFFRSEE